MPWFWGTQKNKEEDDNDEEDESYVDDEDDDDEDDDEEYETDEEHDHNDNDDEAVVAGDESHTGSTGRKSHHHNQEEELNTHDEQEKEKVAVAVAVELPVKESATTADPMKETKPSCNDTKKSVVGNDNVESLDEHETDEPSQQEDEGKPKEENGKPKEDNGKPKEENGKPKKDSPNENPIQNEEEKQQIVEQQPMLLLSPTTEVTTDANPQADGDHSNANPQGDDHHHHEHDDDDDDEHVLGELVLQGAIPHEVSGHDRGRALSMLTQDDDLGVNSLDDDDDEAELASEEEVETVELEEDEEEELEPTTTLQDKQSLLLLAAEHDRVDILNSVLSSATNAAGEEEQKQEKTLLLSGPLPPLHVAILYGSMNAINCLLRVGADPSIRPNLDDTNVSPEQLKSVPHAKKYLHGRSAWEMVFRGNLDLPPSKKEGIRHAFSAEALRCIGSDEATRLQQILDAGVPPNLDMGGKSLFDWSVEMDAPKCQAALRPPEDTHQHTATKKSITVVLDRPGGEATNLKNRLEELESLARALSTCLDNLAEEVSVCHGLLLMGGGAAALAAHVKSLKAQKEHKLEEFTRHQEAYEHTLDELAYWVREAGPKGQEIAQKYIPTILPGTATTPNNQKKDNDASDRQRHSVLLAQIAASETKVRKLRVSIADLSEENTRDLKEVERRGLTGGITLVRNLRDDIREVEFQSSQLAAEEATCRAKIHLLQKHVQQQPKVLPTTTSNEPEQHQQQNLAEATTVTTPTRPQSKTTESQETAYVKPQKTPVPQPPKAKESDTNGIHVRNVQTEQQMPQGDHTSIDNQAVVQRATTVNSGVSLPAAITESERIATGQSTAIAVSHKGGRGYFPASLWQILLRIIGIRDVPPAMPRSNSSMSTSSRRNVQPAVII